MKPKAVIVYKSRYGATAQYAQWLSEILRAPAYDSSEISNGKLNEYDLIIAGGSVYVGKIQIAKWINERKNILTNKRVILFVVCASPDGSDKEHLDMLSNNIDKVLLNRISVFFLKGRMIKKNLSFKDSFILRMGAALQKSKADKQRMLTDFDGVREEKLSELVHAATSSHIGFEV